MDIVTATEFIKSMKKDSRRCYLFHTMSICRKYEKRSEQNLQLLCKPMCAGQNAFYVVNKYFNHQRCKFLLTSYIQGVPKKMCTLEFEALKLIQNLELIIFFRRPVSCDKKSVLPETTGTFVQTHPLG